MAELDETEPDRSRVWDILWLIAGVVVALGLTIVIGGLSMLAPMVGMFLVLSIGLVQFIWIVPLAIVALVVRRLRFAGYGLLAGALIVLLIQSACYGIFCGPMLFDTSYNAPLKMPPRSPVEDVDCDVVAQIAIQPTSVQDALDAIAAHPDLQPLSQQERITCMQRGGADQVVIDALANQP